MCTQHEYFLPRLDSSQGGVEITPFVGCETEVAVRLTSESVQGTSLPLQSIHHIKGCYSLTASVLCVGDSIPDDVLEEDLHRANIVFSSHL